MALLKIAAMEVYRFHIPFIAPMKVGDVLLHQREGFLLALKDHEGRTGLGEVAPLSGWDQISLESCRNDLSVMRRTLNNASFDFSQFNLATPGLGLTALPVSFNPHALFGLESALLSLYLQEELKQARASLPDPIKVPVNGLFVPDPLDGEASGQIKTLQASGVKTVKVKIGRLSADEEIRQMLSLGDAIGKDFVLRLDGNRNLSAEAYLHYYAALRHLNVEYSEEPLNGGETLTPDRVPWPMALDESLPAYLQSESPDRVKLPTDIQTVILKPGLLPGLSGMARFMSANSGRSLQTVLSSSFNTGATLATLGVFSRLAGLSPLTACGFDTLRYLTADVLRASPSIFAGALLIPLKLFSEMHLNFNVLTREAL